MSEVGERLARIEENQKHTDYQVDRLVNITQQLADNQSVISSMQVKIDKIDERQKKFEAQLENVSDKVNQIDKNSMQNKVKIAGLVTTVSAFVAVATYWVKIKLFK